MNRLVTFPLSSWQTW